MTWLVCPCCPAPKSSPAKAGQDQPRRGTSQAKTLLKSHCSLSPPPTKPLATFVVWKRKKKPKKKINKIKLIFFLFGFVNVLEKYGELISSADWNNRKWQLLTRLCPTWRVRGSEWEIGGASNLLFQLCFQFAPTNKAVKNEKRLSAINKINREKNISLSRAEFNSTQNWVLHDTPPLTTLPLLQPLARQVIESKHDKIYFFFGGRKYTKIVFQTRRVMHAKLSQIIFKKIKLNLRWSRRGCVWVCTALGWTRRCPVKGKKVSRRRKEQQLKRRFDWH